jgi:hypothetical protein
MTITIIDYSSFNVVDPGVVKPAASEVCTELMDSSYALCHFAFVAFIWARKLSTAGRDTKMLFNR